MGINPENWTHTKYQRGVLSAQIFYGAEPVPASEIFSTGSSNELSSGPSSSKVSSSIRDLYYLNLQDQEGREIFQSIFDSLPSACQAINHKYGDWQFVDLEAENADKSGSGCSTCSAH